MALVLFSFLSFAQSPAMELAHPLGVRPDCTEKKISPEEFVNIAKKSTDIVSLLENIPTDSLQTFTFVTNSQSIQKDGVSPEWPRVIRTSTDGKITMAYTCNPNDKSYNTVEVIYYDENNEAKTLSLNYRENAQEKIKHNEQSCVACHGASGPNENKSLKHIWPEYFHWDDCKDKSQKISMYGANDDGMDASPDGFRKVESVRGGKFDRNKECEPKSSELNEQDLIQMKHNPTQALLYKKNQESISNFKRFKEKNLGTGENYNPCYALLPWAKPVGVRGTHYDPEIYQQYPYVGRYQDKLSLDANEAEDLSKKRNYYIRPNFRMTVAYSIRNSKRLLNELKRNQYYEKAKYFIGLEAANCLNQEDVKQLNELIPGLNYSFAAPMRGNHTHTDPRTASPLLYRFSEFAQLGSDNWTLEYNDADPQYFVGMSRGRKGINPNLNKNGEDSGIAELVGGALIQDIANEDTLVASASKGAYRRGFAEATGEQWSCVDEDGKTVREEAMGEGKPLCVSLRDSLNQNIVNPQCLAENSSPVLDELKNDVNRVERQITKESAKSGSEIFASKCLKCHGLNGPGQDYRKSYPASVPHSMALKAGLSQDEERILSDFLKSTKKNNY